MSPGWVAAWRGPGTVLLVLSMLASGCLGGPDDGEPITTGEMPAPGGDDPAQAGPEPDEPEAVPAAPTARTVHLRDDGRLVADLPAAGQVPMKGSFVECFVVRPCSVLEFVSDPVAAPTMVLPGEIVVDLYLTADVPVLPTNIFDYGVWFGSTDAVPAFAMISDTGPVMPGETKHVRMAVDFQGAPMVLPAGASFRLMVITAMLQESTGVLKLATGGDTPSAVTFRAQELPPQALPPPGPATTESFTGALASGSFPAGAPEDQTSMTHAFLLSPNATRLDVQLRQTGGTWSQADLDVDLHVDGTWVAGGHTPYGEERIFLAGPALEGLAGREATLRVVLFMGAQVEYEVVVVQS